MNSSLYRFSTTTCNSAGTQCVTQYVPEITTFDFVLFACVVIFILLPHFWHIMFSPFNKGRLKL